MCGCHRRSHSLFIAKLSSFARFKHWWMYTYNGQNSAGNRPELQILTEFKCCKIERMLFWILCIKLHSFFLFYLFFFVIIQWKFDKNNFWHLVNFPIMLTTEYGQYYIKICSIFWYIDLWKFVFIGNRHWSS